MKEITYKNYLLQPDALSFESAMEIYHKIYDIVRTEDELKSTWDFALHAMTVYADLRANWLLQSKDEHHEAGRTGKHDAVIHSLDALKDAMDTLELDTSWRDQLGNARKRIGDFACYVAMLHGIVAR